MNELQLYDVNEAAKLMKLSPWTIRALVSREKLRALRIGRRVLFQHEELKRFIDQAKTESNGSESTESGGNDNGE